MIAYMQRTQAYYAAQGYPAYQWAHHDSTPFAPMPKPLAQARLVLLTTAAPFRPELGDQGAGARYNADAKFFAVYSTPLAPLPDLRISHIGYDRVHCAADDPATWLPVAALQQAQRQGQIGTLAPELIGIPTNRSQRVTTQQDAPRALQHVQRLAADIALLVPT